MPMKHSSYLFILLLLSAVVLTGCEMIGDIFQAGVWTGVFLVILIIGIVVWFLRKPMI
jgi:hypothetical protein